MKQILTAILIVWCSSTLAAGEMFAPSASKLLNIDQKWKITPPSRMKFYADQYRDRVWMNREGKIVLYWGVKPECAEVIEREVIEHTKDDIDFLMDTSRQADAFTVLMAEHCLPDTPVGGEQPDLIIKIK
jgi:hypothetical protein